MAQFVATSQRVEPLMLLTKDELIQLESSEHLKNTLLKERVTKVHSLLVREVITGDTIAETARLLREADPERESIIKAANVSIGPEKTPYLVIYWTAPEEDMWDIGEWVQAHTSLVTEDIWLSGITFLEHPLEGVTLIDNQQTE